MTMTIRLASTIVFIGLQETNTIGYYNMVLLSQLAAHKERAGDVQGAALLAHVSPVAWQHINFYGRYEFSTGPEAINLEEIIQELAQVLFPPALANSS